MKTIKSILKQNWHLIDENGECECEKTPDGCAKLFLDAIKQSIKDILPEEVERDNSSSPTTDKGFFEAGFNAAIFKAKENEAKFFNL